MPALPPPKRVFEGLRNPRTAARYLYNQYPVTNRIGLEASSRGLLGTHVFTRDWDVLLVLDTCRVDALRMVADEYDFLEDVGRICSVGGSSPEWISATFKRSWADELRDTGYLACNGFADFALESGGDPDEFFGPSPDDRFFTGHWDWAHKSELGRLEHVWEFGVQQEGPTEKGEGPTLPRYVTDRTIAVGRKFDFDRIIAHYHQPHTPYVANAVRNDREMYAHEGDALNYLRDGGAKEMVFGAYLDELRYVLDDIELLLENINAETVAITADHGEAFGEYGVYGHSPGSLHPKVRLVPWAETSATDDGSYESEHEAQTKSGRDVYEMLKTLGYRE